MDDIPIGGVGSVQRVYDSEFTAWIELNVETRGVYFCASLIVDIYLCASCRVLMQLLLGVCDVAKGCFGSEVACWLFTPII